MSRNSLAGVTHSCCVVHDNLLAVSNLGVTAPTFRTNLVQTQQEFSFESPIQLEAAHPPPRDDSPHTGPPLHPQPATSSPTPPRLFQHANRLPVPPLVCPPPSASVCAARATPAAGRSNVAVAGLRQQLALYQLQLLGRPSLGPQRRHHQAGVSLCGMVRETCDSRLGATCPRQIGGRRQSLEEWQGDG